MPELPEVEAVARALRPFVRGQTICCCRVIHSIAVRPGSGRGAKGAAELLVRAVRGARVRTVNRRGKYLVLILDRGAIVMHFRLDGHLLWFDSRKISGHVDVALEFPRGTLGFADRRHFGRIQWIQSPEEIPGIRRLGLEPFSKHFTSRALGEKLRTSRLPLKLFLLDQSKIAGLGNIYSSEAMWLARLDPRRRAYSISASEARRLHKAIVRVLRRALECCLHPAPDFRDADWWFQGLERILNVYDREGKSCRRCRQPIRRTEQGGRSTYFCAGCQE
ncbi:MAG TPA: DNA-formamidopyrimidine glycosylase [Candidatus Limnocylindrales bacterium]|nr:DNA-formamidopyrimidine glycosylase [Candidatus Limnocylindrales bacterium]